MDINTIFKVGYGLYILSSMKGERYNGCIINTISQVNSEPITFQAIISKMNYTYEFIKESGLFSVSILNQDVPFPFIGTFGFKSGRDINKFQNIKYKLGEKKVPIVLDHTVAYLVCEVFQTVDVNTHTMFIGNLIDAEILSDATPLTYAYYRDFKKGKSSKNAPTYINPAILEKKKEETDMDKYVCEVCGYVYDPSAGDPDSGIKPGTKFEDLPADWVCPVCGAGKEEFKRE